MELLNIKHLKYLKAWIISNNFFFREGKKIQQGIRFAKASFIQIFKFLPKQKNNLSSSHVLK